MSVTVAQVALESHSNTEAPPLRDHLTNLPEEILLSILQLLHLDDDSLDPDANRWTISLLNRRVNSLVQLFLWRRMTRGQPQLVEKLGTHRAGGYQKHERQLRLSNSFRISNALLLTAWVLATESRLGAYIREIDMCDIGEYPPVRDWQKLTSRFLGEEDWALVEELMRPICESEAWEDPPKREPRDDCNSSFRHAATCLIFRPRSRCAHVLQPIETTSRIEEEL